MTAVIDPRARAAAPLAPISATLRVAFGTDDLPGLHPGLLVDNEIGWIPATSLIDGDHLPRLLDSAAQRWQAKRHAAAALAWKAYSYWVALPVALGWASARRVPLLRADDVLLRMDDTGPLVDVGLRIGTRIAVLPGDPLAVAGLPEVLVVPDEDAMLRALRESLLDQHMIPLLDKIHSRSKLGPRTLLGSLSSGIAYAVLQAADTLPGSSAETIGTLLDALDIGDLIELVPGPDGALTVQRRTCCLAFTLPDPKVCPGCCIRP
ncbi:hypothetical protein [Micromonospora sp. NBC_01813]|uniref:hypothetical protein n=1 Tax=Micromonospora sp. NBC_01813 TaxID=2975988 RepID=UPI002DD8CF88|nr:hypothetical protein [Micromonospora sp. NBC_01813]WSA07271.1 hypothetical protein OG958_23860 [Micromonospora sp. NBC_01813]